MPRCMVWVDFSNWWAGQFWPRVPHGSVVRSWQELAQMGQGVWGSWGLTTCFILFLLFRTSLWCICLDFFELPYSLVVLGQSKPLPGSLGLWWECFAGWGILFISFSVLALEQQDVSHVNYSADPFDFSEVKMKLLSHVRLFAIPWTVAYQAPRSMEFSRQEYWSGLPFPLDFNQT